MEGDCGVGFGSGMKILAMAAFAHIENKSMGKEDGFYFPRFTRYEFGHTGQNANRIPAGAVILAWLT